MPSGFRQFSKRLALVAGVLALGQLLLYLVALTAPNQELAGLVDLSFFVSPLAIGLIVLWCLLCVGLLNLAAGGKPQLSAGYRQRCLSKWREAEDLLAREDAHAWRGAVVSLDALLDEALGKRGYQGTLGEKLKAHGAQLFRDLDGVWSAHKYRNRLVHDVDLRPDQRSATRAAHQLRQALEDIGAL